jgi:acyl carrier protein
MESSQLLTVERTDEPAEVALVRRIVAASSGGRHTPESLSGSMSLKDAGVDSLKLIVMILEIETKLRRKIFNADNLGKMHTLDDLLRVAVGPRVESQS